MKLKNYLFVCLFFVSMIFQNCNFEKNPIASNSNDFSNESKINENNQYDELVFGFNFDEIKGAQVLNLSSNNLNGEIIGGTRISGIMNNAVRFENDRSRIEINMPRLPNEPATVEVPFEDNKISCFAWIKLDKEQKNSIQHLFGDGYLGLKSFRVQVENGKLQFLINDNIGWIEVITSKISLSFDEWQHIGITYDGTTAKIYLNGKEDNTRNLSIPVPTIYNTIYLGSVPVDFNAGLVFGNQLSGAIDELFIYKKILSDSEIQDTYKINL